MKKITQKSVAAFLNRKPFKSENTEVEICGNIAYLKLFGNRIATLYDKFDRDETILEITNCGWETNTTKERLNALPNVSIHQKNWQWYLNGVAWDGKKTEIKL
jgi:hypothetical protein